MHYIANECGVSSERVSSVSEWICLSDFASMSHQDTRSVDFYSLVGLFILIMDHMTVKTWLISNSAKLLLSKLNLEKL